VWEDESALVLVSLALKCETTLQISEVSFFLLHSSLTVQLYLASLLKSILVYSQIQSGPVPLVADGEYMPMLALTCGPI
jgi:hypothetical protein